MNRDDAIGYGIIVLVLSLVLYLVAHLIYFEPEHFTNSYTRTPVTTTTEVP